MFRVPSSLLALIVLAACSQGSTPVPGNGPDTGLALAKSSHAKDSLIAVKDSLIAEKSRQLSLQSQLIGDAATSARLVSEIDRDLSKVRGLKIKVDTTKTESAEPNASEQLARVQLKVNKLIARLNTSENRLRKMQADSVTHAAFDSTQIAQLREYEKSIADLRSTVDRQRQEIAMLTTRVDSVTKVTVALTAHNDSITAQNNAMAAHEDSVFVAIGTEKDLTSKGIVRREGGTLLMFGRGKTLVPARTLDPSAFTAMSKSHDLTIALPKTDKDYRVVSRQSLEFTDNSNPKNQMVRGSLKITNPGAFWSTSKYLILVQR